MNVNREFLLQRAALGYPLRALVGRATGRTTAIALRLVLTAIQQPGVELTAEDHHPTRERHRAVFDMARRIADTLGLHGWVWNSSKLTVLNNVTEVLVDEPPEAIKVGRNYRGT